MGRKACPPYGTSLKHARLLQHHAHAQALFYMTAFLTKALTEGRGVGLPAWWPLDYVSTIVSILAYVTVARYLHACVHLVLPSLSLESMMVVVVVLLRKTTMPCPVSFFH